MFRKSLTEEQISKEIQIAKMHAKVSRVMIRNDNKEYCQCCNQIIYKQQYPLLCNVQDFLHLGILFPLYFQTLVYLGYFMIIASLFSFVNVFLNSFGTSCINVENIVCTFSITNIISYDDKHLGILHFQSISNYIFIGISILYLEFFTHKLQHKRNILSSTDINQSDYGIVYKDVKQKSKQKVYQQIKILQKIYKKRTGRDNLIVKFIMLLNLKQIAQNQQNKIINQQFLQNQKNYLASKQSQIIIQQNSEISRTQSLLIKNQKKENQYQFSGKVIVLFQYPVSHKDFNNVRIQQLTDASDIIWENIGVKKQLNKNVLMLVATILLMVATFGAIVVIKQWIKHLSIDQHLVVTTILNLLVATIVAVFNSIQGIVIRYCARQELYGTHSKFFRIVARRLSYVFFMNMVMSTFFANFFILLQRKQEENRVLPINYNGLVNDFFFLFLTNSYISSIFNYFDLFWGAKLYKRYKAQVRQKIHNITKDELKFIFEGHPVDMGLRYGNILKTLFFTASISPFVPSGPILSLLGIIICYWVDKYLLLRRYVCRHQLNWNFAKEMIQFSKFYVVLFSFSNILIQMIPIDKGDNQVQMPDFQKHSNFYISILMFLFSMFYKFLFNITKKLIFGKVLRGKKNKLGYNQAKHLFRNQYEDKLDVTDVYELNEQKIESRLSQKLEMDPKLLKSLRESILQRIYTDTF